MDTKKEQDILTRIKGLIANADSYKEMGNEKAAEAYALKAQELLSKYKLELSDLDRAEEEENNPFTYELVEPSLWGDLDKQGRVETTENLAATIAEAFFCRILVVMESNKLIIVGRKSDIDITKYLLAVVIRSALADCEIELATIINEQAQLSQNAPSVGGMLWRMSGGNEEFRYSFLSGFNNRIHYRLKEQARKIEEGACNALILRDANQAVEDYLETLNPAKLEENHTRQSMMSRAFNKGMDYGDKVSLVPNALTDTNKNKIGA